MRVVCGFDALVYEAQPLVAFGHRRLSIRIRVRVRVRVRVRMRVRVRVRVRVSVGVRVRVRVRYRVRVRARHRVRVGMDVKGQGKSIGEVTGSSTASVYDQKSPGVKAQRPHPSAIFRRHLGVDEPSCVSPPSFIVDAGTLALLDGRFTLNNSYMGCGGWGVVADAGTLALIDGQ